jgi:phosphatidylserine/phosphatidylglycerophosphate/cardiolipin synthase-like enzyme
MRFRDMKIKPYQVQLLLSGLAYGGGLLIGNIISFFLFEQVPPNWFIYDNPATRLAAGVLLAFFISGLGGLLGGGIGGWTLPIIRQKGDHWGYAWRSGITFGVGYGLLLFPVILSVSLLAYYDVAYTPVFVFGLLFGIVGLFFGSLMGVSLGRWTTGRHFWPITGWSAAGFGLGGIVLGAGIWFFIFNMDQGMVRSGPYSWLLAGLFLFAGFGGLGLAIAYHRLAMQTENVLTPIRALTKKGWRRRWSVVAVVMLLLAILFRPVILALGDLLTPVDAGLSPVLDLPTMGTHWLDAVPITAVSPLSPPTLAANTNGQLGLAWVQDDALWLQAGEWQPTERQIVWQPAFAVAMGSLSEPAVALTENGRFYLTWVANNTIVTSQCLDNGCTPPTPIAAPASCDEPAEPGNRQPTLAVNDNTVLLVWANEAGILPYAAWSMADPPPAEADGCVPAAAAAPQLNNAFDLVFETGTGSVSLTRFDGTAWAEVAEVGNGRYPTLILDANQQPHIAFCTDEGIAHWQNGTTELIDNGRCTSRPSLALDAQGQLHAIWFGSQVPNVNNIIRPSSLLLESVKIADRWTLPAIIGRSLPQAQPALTAAGDGSLHLAWAGEAGLQAASYVPYTCDTADLSRLGRILYDLARQESVAPPSDPVPFCHNRYDQFLITPNPKPAYRLPEPPTPNGAFDVMAELIRGAQHEVLFTTMWYGAQTEGGSPGSVIAAAVADLYRNLQAHPEQYPRGLTVRILLGNPPELAMGEMSGQLWSLLDDLRQAGVDKMVDEELGWRLEVADFEGNLPHSHVKAMVVDGKTAVTVGYNMTADHFPLDHPSGRGRGRFDLGLQMTGPVAQATLRMFDDMWQGADGRKCLDFNPPLGFPWQLTCFGYTVKADHAPEVLKFYQADHDSAAFSMYRSREYGLADKQTAAVIAAAQERVDIVHVMFSLNMICNLNVLFNICTVDMAPVYKEALIQAAENGAHLRILVKPAPFEGIENKVALDAFWLRLHELGFADRVEVRFYNGPMHPKVILIDDELLIVGSQNLHYSAFHETWGLTEHSIGTDDEQAIADFKRIFDVEWAASQN